MNKPTDDQHAYFTSSAMVALASDREVTTPLAEERRFDTVETIATSATSYGIVQDEYNRRVHDNTL
jgi:hypothetical protein